MNEKNLEVPKPSTTTSKQNGYFINGKNQVVEMLQLMTGAEKSRLLNHIRHKNPTLAVELSEQSLSFEHLNSLQDTEIVLLFKYVPAEILGMALKGTSVAFQRRVLVLADRSYAELAFDVLVNPITNEKVNNKRAQAKVLDTVRRMIRKQVLNVF